MTELGVRARWRKLEKFEGRDKCIQDRSRVRVGAPAGAPEAV